MGNSADVFFLLRRGKLERIARWIGVSNISEFNELKVEDVMMMMMSFLVIETVGVSTFNMLSVCRYVLYD